LKKKRKKEIAFFMWIEQEKKGKTQKNRILMWTMKKKITRKKGKKNPLFLWKLPKICTGDVNSEEREREEKPRI